MARVPAFGRAGAELLLLVVGLVSQLGPGLCAKCECSADACTKDTLVVSGTSTPCVVGADGVLGHNIHVRAGAPRRREQQIGGSGGSLEPPGPLLEPPGPLLIITNLCTVYMGYYECLSTRSEPPG
jgi:hypothetical protein